MISLLLAAALMHAGVPAAAEGPVHHSVRALSAAAGPGAGGPGAGGPGAGGPGAGGPGAGGRGAGGPGGKGAPLPPPPAATTAAATTVPATTMAACADLFQPCTLTYEQSMDYSNGLPRGSCCSSWNMPFCSVSNAPTEPGQTATGTCEPGNG